MVDIILLFLVEGSRVDDASHHQKEKKAKDKGEKEIHELGKNPSGHQGLVVLDMDSFILFIVFLLDGV